jgi:hypothetical protein
MINESSMTSAVAAQAQGTRHIYFRTTILVLAALLCAQCIWLLLAEFSRPWPGGLPLDATAAAAAAKDRDRTLWAASIGGVRGDLWAASAFTYADLAINEDGTDTRSAADPAIARLRANVERALDNAPTQYGVWLLRAGLARRYSYVRWDALEALRMTYYTGPSDRSIVPLRLRLAVQTDRFDDVEIREFASRDIRVLLAVKQYSAIAAAYALASNVGRQLIEQTVRDIDPSELKNIGSISPKIEQLPN